MPRRPQRRATTPPPKRFYFAYGSNMWLQQMAARCPKSRYIGRAVLPDYMWQINERGFANVVKCEGYSVHGLVYAISDGDETRLDRNEGVSNGVYSKTYKSVVLHLAPSALQLPTRRLIEDEAEAVLTGARLTTQRQGERLQRDVLVYLSERYVQQGNPRDEYVDRMNMGVRDAIALGVPEDFFYNFVRRYIPRQPVSRNSGGSNGGGVQALPPTRRRLHRSSAAAARSASEGHRGRLPIDYETLRERGLGSFFRW